MSKLVDYIPKLNIELNAFQEMVGIILATILLIWSFVSLLFVLVNGGSLFEDDPKCTTFCKLTWKYSPPWWRKTTKWFFLIWIAVMIILVISVFTQIKGVIRKS